MCIYIYTPRVLEKERERGRVLARRRRFDERPSRDARGEKEGENGSGEWHGAGCLGTEKLGGRASTATETKTETERERAAKKRARERRSATGERRRQ